ncbi:MAG: TolC family protein [Synechococcaceae cyanobacterium ELA263]
MAAARSFASTLAPSASRSPLAAQPPASAQLPPGAARTSPADRLGLSLSQVLDQGLAVSLRLVRADRQLARDAALTALNRSLLRPELNLIGLGSYTQVGTSVGVLTNLPTLGDLTLSLQQNGYAVLRNSFGNAGVVFNANLLPLRQLAEVAASSSQEAASRASRQESERQARFELVSSYRQLQLSQALVPVWQAALQASTAVAADVQAIHRRGLAAQIDLLRARALQAADRQGLAEVEAQLLAQRQQLAALLDLPLAADPLVAGPLAAVPLAVDPIAEQPAWPLNLQDSVEHALRGRPLLEALRRQQQSQRSQARAARALLYPSLNLVAGAGYSGDQLSVPQLQQGGRLNGPQPLPLPNLEQSGAASGSFYNWGAALLLRQPLWDGGRSASSAAVAERQGELLQADEDLARQQIRQDVSRAWASLQGSATAIAAAREAVTAQQRALGDARLRYRAQVDPLTEVLLVQRDLQASRASLLTALTRQAIDWAVLERETGGANAPQPPS